MKDFFKQISGKNDAYLPENRQQPLPAQPCSSSSVSAANWQRAMNRRDCLPVQSVFPASWCSFRSSQWSRERWFSLILSVQKAFRRHHHSHYYNRNLLQDLCSKYYDQNAQVRPAEMSEQRSVAAVPVQRRKCGYRRTHRWFSKCKDQPWGAELTTFIPF